MKGMIEVENVNTPGKVSRVNAAKYSEMKAALYACLPSASPGLNQNEMREGAKQHLSQTLFPEGKTSGWWAKTVQLDLEAKGLLIREHSKPLRWYLK